MEPVATYPSHERRLSLTRLTGMWAIVSGIGGGSIAASYGYYRAHPHPITHYGLRVGGNCAILAGLYAITRGGLILLEEHVQAWRKDNRGIFKSGVFGREDLLTVTQSSPTVDRILVSAMAGYLTGATAVLLYSPPRWLQGGLVLGAMAGLGQYAMNGLYHWKGVRNKTPSIQPTSSVPSLSINTLLANMKTSEDFLSMFISYRRQKESAWNYYVWPILESDTDIVMRQHMRQHLQNEHLRIHDLKEKSS